ncbi:MAG: TIM barrel protein [Oligosphaeraceae bacterium]
MSLKPFNFGVVTKRVLPFKALKNSSAQPMPLSKILDLVSWAAKENLIEEVSLDDDDILAWSPETADDFKDKGHAMYAQLADLKARLDKAELTVAAITCDLTSHQVFAHGAFSNNDPKVRELARRKAERALEIGRALNASLFVFNGDSEGFDSPFTVSWSDAWKRLAAGLDAISLYASQQHLTNFRGGVIAPRQSAAYLYGFLNTPSDALNLILSLLKDRNFWSIAPATSQLAAQGWEKAPAGVSNIVGARRLAMLKVGGGADKPFKRAPHPILGTANLTETAELFWLLEKMNWKGAVEFDNVTSVSDAKSLNDDMTCKQFIANCSNALTVALQLAEKIKADELAELTPSEADLMAATLLGHLDVDQVILRTIKNLPPAFETPVRQQSQNGRRDGNGDRQQNQNGRRDGNGNGDRQQNQNGRRDNNGNGDRQQNQNGRRDGNGQRRNDQPRQPQPEQSAPAVEPAPAPAVEPAPVAPAVEPVAPAVEPVAPAVEPVASAVEPVAPAASAVEAAPAPEPAVAETVEPVVAPAAEPASAVAEPQPEEPRAVPHQEAGLPPLPPPAAAPENDEEAPAADGEPILLPEEKPAKSASRRSPRRSGGSRSKSSGTRRSPRAKKSGGSGDAAPSAEP